MADSSSSSDTWKLSTGRKRTDLPPSDPPGERRNLEGLVESIAERATHQYYRIQNLFRSADGPDEERQEILRDPTLNAHPEQRFPSGASAPSSSSSAQAARRFFRALPAQSTPLPLRVQEMEKTLDRIELLLQDHTHRLAKLEEQTSRALVPDTPSTNRPYGLELGSETFQGSFSVLDPNFVQSLSNRLEAMEAVFSEKEKEKNKAKAKPSRTNKITRFMGLDDQGHSNKRPRI
ncbi:hypothetical protein PCASD_19432 [Puccinia coronata f. sp. avenae]|uniref:Uncharacterized protein n=1 Tax=Puccinia coronata f. sp. avenae TaxID=200324 RepID=A0A2N5SRD7_9BASI|nr:hypothetical protein PCASD_19432 [Puccinia coronata f. sp. avenae]